VKNRICYLSVFILLSVSGNNLTAQPQISELTKRFELSGFENIRILHVNNKSLIITYENNLFRNKSTALSTVLDSLHNCGYDTLKIITLINDLPVVITKLSSQNWQQYRTGKISFSEIIQHVYVSYKTDKVWKQLRNSVPVNPHINKIDLIIYPQLAVMNARFNRIYEVQFNIAPALEVSLWRGMKFTGQIIFPICSDYQYGNESYLIRPGFVTLAQEFRLPGTILGRAVIGKFNESRYGADLTLTHFFLAGQCYWSMNAGYTGLYKHYENGWYSDDLNTLTFFLKSGYFYKPYNLQFDASAGRYLNGDYGLRYDCTRYWNETAIGFYGLVAGRHLNGGFHFTIPLFPKRYKKNRYFQLRTPYYFGWEYNAKSENYYGQYYETRPDGNRVEHFYNPYLLIKNLRK
jgi:hypothetical protein